MISWEHEQAATVREILARGIGRLAGNSESPRSDAQRLLAQVLGRERSWLIANGERTLTEGERLEFSVALARRCSGLPLAYVLESWGFYGRNFETNRDVLVPRPETEHLVEAALWFLHRRSDGSTRGLNVLDVGTGSGAIACTLAAECANAIVDATDISAAAIAVARRNAARLGVLERCAFFVGALAKPVTGKRYDCVIANLPYIPSAQLPRRPDAVAYEPRVALDGGADGLDIYRRLLPQLPWLLKADALVLLEAAPPATAGLFALACRQFPEARVRVERDYGARERFVAVERAAR